MVSISIFQENESIKPKGSKFCFLEPEIVQHGIPHIIHFGDFAGYKVLVMTKTGPTLLDIVNATDEQKFEFDVISDIAIQSVCHCFSILFT